MGSLSRALHSNGCGHQDGGQLPMCGVTPEVRVRQSEAVPLAVDARPEQAPTRLRTLRRGCAAQVFAVSQLARSLQLPSRRVGGSSNAHAETRSRGWARRTEASSISRASHAPVGPCSACARTSGKVGSRSRILLLVFFTLFCTYSFLKYTLDKYEFNGGHLTKPNRKQTSTYEQVA